MPALELMPAQEPVLHLVCGKIAAGKSTPTAGLGAHGRAVVLDFPAHTRAGRAWMRTLFEEAGVAHRLHDLDVPDDVCRARLRARNASVTHDFTVTDAEFALFTQYFVAPTPEAGFDVFVRRP